MARSRMGRRGQYTVEIALLMMCVVAALVAMAVYYQRAAQGGVRSNADSLGQQFSATKGFTVTSNSNTVETKTNITSKQNSNYNQTF